MARIRVLNPHVVNQIAAGEVVERPSSVVKELVENAIDADATTITVVTDDGGRTLIEVRDNGGGMSPDDLALAFTPHATSKIADVEDLRHIASMGFRGEALASIGSVARVVITTRRTSDSGAMRLVNDRGSIETPKPAAGPPGTTVRVEHLFRSVPARRKFMRTAATELGHIRDAMGRFALAYPEIGFRLEQGTRVILDVPPEQDRRKRIERLYGRETADALLQVEAVDDDLTLEGWVGPPSKTRRDSRWELVFLNGRHISDRTTAHALRQAYRDLLPPGGQRPIAFLFLACDPDGVDVNVHPAKSEVRWQESDRVHRLVRRSIRRVLEDAPEGVPIKTGAPGGAFPDSTSRPYANTQHAQRHAVRPLTARPTSTVAERTHYHDSPSHTAATEFTLSDEPVALVQPPPLRPLGQALGTYLVLEAKDSIVLVDQHALHERVLFDQINRRLGTEGKLEVQQLLVPMLVELSSARRARLLEATEELARLGWLLEPFGEGTIAVQAVPAILKAPKPEEALREILDLLPESGTAELDRTAFVSEAVDRLACRSAVMAGDVLAHDEVLALLEQAEQLNHSHTCPHGRPTRLTLSRFELEKHFHRR